MRIVTSEPAPRSRRATSRPLDVGQADVEDDALDAGRVLGDLEAGRAVDGHLDDVPVVLEQPLEQPPEARVVLDDEQMHGRQPTRSSLGHLTTVTSLAVRSRVGAAVAVPGALVAAVAAVRRCHSRCHRRTRGHPRSPGRRRCPPTATSLAVAAVAV